VNIRYVGVVKLDRFHLKCPIWILPFGKGKRVHIAGNMPGKNKDARANPQERLKKKKELPLDSGIRKTDANIREERKLLDQRKKEKVPNPR